jgi:hypothetical protein
MPIVGNTYQLPDNKPWIYFGELSKKYNTPLITFWIGRSVSGVVGLHAIANSTLEILRYGSMMLGLRMSFSIKEPGSTVLGLVCSCSLN